MAKQPIQIAYYEKTEEEQRKFIQNMKLKIKKSDDLLLKKMMGIVEEEVMKYDSDFYVHDIALLKDLEKNEAVLWIVRNHGTHFIHLSSENFNSDGIWTCAEYFKTIFHNYKRQICGYYLIENEKLIKVSEKSAFATIAIYEDIAKNKTTVQKKIYPSFA